MNGPVGFISSRAGYFSQALWAEAGVTRPLRLLRDRFGSLVVSLSLAPSRLALLDQPLEIDEADFIPLPWMPSLGAGLLQARPALQVIREMEKRCAILIIQLPFDSPLALLGARTPRVYHLCADIREWIVGSTRYRGLRGLPARLLARGIDRLQAQLLRCPTTSTVANGEAIYRRYGSRGRTVISSALSETEILSVRRERPTGAPFRVLFVGYLRHEKGIDVLIRAFRLVQERVPDAELEIVGASHTVDQGIRAELERELAVPIRAGHVHVLSAQPFGPQLFQRFADADVLALPSRSEGTPRVLIEARAFGCPVVASRVGGIPSSVEDEVDGLLVPSGDAEALANALIRVRTDEELRQRLIVAGIERARNATVEKFARDLGDEVIALQNRCGL